MSERSREWVLERVRKLLALGQNSGATEGERDNAMRMAHALLAKYNLDMAEVNLKTGETEDRIVLKSQFYGRPWARVVAYHTARLFMADYIYMEATKATETTHFFIGKQSNAITACEMSAYLVTSIQREARKSSELGNAWVRSFCLGAAHRLIERVDEILAKSAQQTSGTGTSLVLASLYQLEQTANTKLKDELFPQGERKQGRKAKDDGIRLAYEHGQDYAESLGLNRQIEGQADKPKLERRP